MVMQQTCRTWQRLSDCVTMVHCKNPGMYTLCGTNCFVIGKGPLRTLIDPGDLPERNQEFLTNFRDFLSHHCDVKFNRILVTHGHFDHYGGVYEAIDLLRQTGQASENLQTFKKLTGNDYESHVFETFPQLRDSVETIIDKQQFKVEEGLTIEAIATPGHLDDHVSFLLREQKTLVCGDLILGAPSAAVQDLDAYLASLARVQSLDLDWILLPHSVALDSPDFVMVAAQEKIQEYVDYRVNRLNELLACFESGDKEAQSGQSDASRSKKLSRQELYDMLYGPKNLAEVVKVAAYRNLDLQTDKLCREGLLRYDEQREVFERMGIARFKL